MRQAQALIRSALVAAFLLGAAIPTAAQKRKPARQPPATKTPNATAASPPNATAATEPAPAKKNARTQDAASSQPITGVAPAPAAKKNTPQRTPEQAGDAGASARGDAGAASRGADATRFSYEFSQPEFDVRRVVIEHDAAGRGQITFERKNEATPLTEPLAISPSAFARIAAAWEALKFLDSDASYQSDRQFPHLGTVRLRMRRDGRERTAEFNWTHNEQASALAREYRRLTEQQLFVFDVGVARQYQPSETVRVLKRLEILLDREELSDPKLLTDLLRDLHMDERIPLIARNHAARLLKKIEKAK